MVFDWDRVGIPFVGHWRLFLRGDPFWDHGRYRLTGVTHG